METKIDIAIKRLEMVTQWISNCDTKISFVLTFYGVAITILFTSGFDFYKILHFECTGGSFLDIIHFFRMIICLVFFVLLCSTFYYIFKTLKARVEPNIKDSNIFFGLIAKKEFEDFQKEVDNETQEKLLKDVYSQIYINSKIADEKFLFYNKSLSSLFWSLIVCFILLVLNTFS